MSAETMNLLIYVALAVGGYAIHWLQNRAGVPASPEDAPASNPIATPSANQGRISIGHGELLSLLMSALMTPPPVLMPTPAGTAVQAAK